ncbi:MAG: sigma 54-interacting transcriptional regulator [Myxococcota bacterium]
MANETVAQMFAGRPLKSLRIEVVEGPDRGKVATAPDRLSVGSAPTNGLVLSDDTVSRYHVELIGRDDRVEVVDNGSKNGTWVGSAAIVRGFVTVGTTLRVGRTVLRVLDGETFTSELIAGDRLGPVIGQSVVMRGLLAKVQRCAPTTASVLLTGETGSGKEVVARAIHESSTRAGGPFETVDCGSMVENLMVSELFGHEKGAFTGADRQHIGAFERAHGGSIFLDEIGELPPSLQTALLGALERRSFRRVGGTERINVDVRLISATHRDLRAAVNAGRFREDLFYRIAVVTLEIPPLRERRDDIPLLAEHFLRTTGAGATFDQVFDQEGLSALMAHDWPGNVRELRNVVEATLALGSSALGQERGGAPVEPHLESSGGGGAAPIIGGGGIALSPLLGLPYADARAQLLDQFEASYLRGLIERNDGNVAAAAREAQMDRTYLTRLLKKRGVKTRRDFPE